jgi:CheY-like chemotaxis protein
MGVSHRLSTAISPDAFLSSHDIGHLLQMNPTSVAKWITDGHIHGFRTPGGHRRVQARELVRFLNEYKMPIPKPLALAAIRRVLVVDPDPGTAKDLVRRMKKRTDQIEVATAMDGVQGLVKVGAFEPHLVVLSLELPDISGLEVCRRLKDREHAFRGEVALMTHNPTRALVEKARSAGAAGCLQTPIDVAVLMQHAGVNIGGDRSTS